MKAAKFCLITFTMALLIQLIRMNIAIDSGLSSLIVWFVQYPLLILSIIFLFTFLFGTANHTIRKGFLLIVPTVVFILYFIIRLTFTFFR